jgi:hypothetical protein
MFDRQRRFPVNPASVAGANQESTTPAWEVWAHSQVCASGPVPHLIKEREQQLVERNPLKGHDPHRRDTLLW